MSLRYPKVSILMPSLNSGEYIRECMDSVVKQTLPEIEIICIDAESTDGTLEILREYEKKDSRVRVIVSDKKSMGYQYNLGLAAASGDYVGMVETDDWIEPDTFECLWTAAASQDVDIVAANHYHYYTEPEVRNRPFENLCNCPYEKVFCPRDILHSFAVTPLIWSAIYRRSMLENNGIRFNETPGASFQDTSFHFMVMTVAQTVFFLNRYFYHYRCDSETQSINSGGKVYCMCDEAHYYERFLEGRPADKFHLFKPYMAWKYDKYYWNYARIAPQFQWEFLMRFREEFADHRKAGLLEKSTFADMSGYNAILKPVNEMIDHPVRFFKNTCKKYCTWPKEEDLPEAQLLSKSASGSPYVSIIIPLHNEKNRVTASLESARKQTLKNLEIICVDDGSDDATLSLIMEQADIDSRLTVLHQDNQGAASAKNRGLRFACGKYVLFLSGGDRLREDAAEMLVSLADKNCLDVVCFESVSLSENDREGGRDACVSELSAENVITGTDLLCSVHEQRSCISFACTALYNRIYLKNRKICFIDGIFYEDRVFRFFVLSEAERVYHLKEILCFTEDNSNLPIRKFFWRTYSYFAVYQAILQKYRSLPYSDKLQDYVKKELRDICSSLRDIYRSVNNKELCRSKFSDTELCLFDKLTGSEDMPDII